MKCREARTQIRRGLSAQSISQELRERVLEHTGQCAGCRRELTLEGLTSALFKAYCAEETAVPDNPYLMTRITARIRELGEHGVGSWESAVLSLRGWVIGFAAAAALLFSFSVSSRLQLFSSSNETSFAAQDVEATSLSALSEDFISESTRLVDDDGRLIPDSVRLQRKAAQK